VQLKKFQFEEIMAAKMVLGIRYCNIRWSALQNGYRARNGKFLLVSDAANSVRIIVMIISELQ